MPYANREEGLKNKKDYYLKNKDRFSERRHLYYLKNRERIIIKSKQNITKNKERRLKYIKEYYLLNKEKISAYHREYRKKHNHDIIIPRRNRNRLKTAARMRIYRADRIKIDIQYKLSINLRNRLLQAIKKHAKSGSAVKDLGCTISQFKTYIENKFSPGMTWKNWSRKGWHLDHIKPLKDFDLSNRKQFLIACHYTNMQPLWAKDNLAKRFI